MGRTVVVVVGATSAAMMDKLAWFQGVRQQGCLALTLSYQC